MNSGVNITWWFGCEALVLVECLFRKLNGEAIPPSKPIQVICLGSESKWTAPLPALDLETDSGSVSQLVLYCTAHPLTPPFFVIAVAKRRIACDISLVGCCHEG